MINTDRLLKPDDNNNTILFEKYGNPDRYPETAKLIEKFKRLIEKEHLDINDFVLDSGAVLAIWGLRESSDIDYYYSGGDTNVINADEFENHFEQLNYHDKPLNELIYNSDNYFMYLGVKFLSLENVAIMKSRRGEVNLNLINKIYMQMEGKSGSFTCIKSENRSKFTNYVLQHCQEIREGSYTIQRDVDPTNLLVPERIDIAAKLYYIDSYVKKESMEFAKEIYSKHIEAFTRGRFIEDGNEEKNSLDKYYKEFNYLIDTIRDKGFDDSISILPVGKNGELLDGSHRAACAIYFNKKVTIAKAKKEIRRFDYSFFKKRKLSNELLGYMAIEYVKYKKNNNIFFACIWPKVSSKDRMQLLSAFQNETRIIYYEDIKLSYIGLRHFLIQCYQDEEWLGNPDNHFSGVIGKEIDIWKKGNPLTGILFEAESLDKVRKLKERIREYTGMGNSALHTTDDREESLALAQCLFHPNSVHLMNLGILDKYPKIIKALKKTDNTHCYNEEITLGLYGLRNNYSGESINNSFDNDPRSYIYCLGKRIPSLEQCLEHTEDYAMSKQIKELLRKNNKSDILSDFRVKLHWYIDSRKAVLRKKLANCLRKIGLYKTVKKYSDRIIKR